MRPILLAALVALAALALPAAAQVHEMIGCWEADLDASGATWQHHLTGVEAGSEVLIVVSGDRVEPVLEVVAGGLRLMAEETGVDPSTGERFALLRFHSTRPGDAIGIVVGDRRASGGTIVVRCWSRPSR